MGSFISYFTHNCANPAPHAMSTLQAGSVILMYTYSRELYERYHEYKESCNHSSLGSVCTHHFQADLCSVLPPRLLLLVLPRLRGYLSLC